MTRRRLIVVALTGVAAAVALGVVWAVGTDARPLDWHER